MTIADDINRAFRDFERFTGDGKPNAPAGAPLPTGDPRSGVHNLAKGDIRGVLLAILQSMGNESALNDLLAQIATKAEAGDVAALQDELRSGRIYYAPAMETPSGQVIPDWADFLETVHIASGRQRSWRSIGAPGDGVETATLVKDSGGRWWSIVIDAAITQEVADRAAAVGLQATALRDGAVIPTTNIGGTGDAITAEIAAAFVNAGITTLSAIAEVEYIPTATNTAANPTITIAGVTFGIRNADNGAWPIGGFVAGRPYKLRRRNTTMRVVTGEVTGAELAARAPLASPALTGAPTAPTPAVGDNSTRIATSAFVTKAVTDEATARTNADALKAPLASPGFTGTPTAPTAAAGTNSTQIATTAFVRAALALLVGSSPSALDTLNELAAALGNDPNFSTTVLNAIAAEGTARQAAVLKLTTDLAAQVVKLAQEITDRSALIDSQGVIEISGYGTAVDLAHDVAGGVATAVLTDGTLLQLGPFQHGMVKTVPQVGGAVSIQIGGVEVGIDSSVDLPEGIAEILGPVDAQGRQSLAIRTDGTTLFDPAPGTLDVSIARYLVEHPIRQADYVVPVTVADLNGRMMCGQSLAAGVLSVAALTTTAGAAFMPEGGIFDGTVNDQGSTGAPDATAFEAMRFVSQNANLGESPIIGGANMLATLTDQLVLGSNHAYGGRSIAQLSPGSTYYSYLIDAIGNYRDIANAEGKTFALQSIWWMQGEADSTLARTREQYAADLMAFADAVSADDAQTHPPALLTYQMSSHTVRGGGQPPEIALGQLLASQRHARIHLVTPMYFVPYLSDSVHLPPHASRWIGQYFAKVDYLVTVLGENWRPLEPEQAVRQGRIVDITFHVPVGPLVFDTTAVSNPGNFGFTATTKGGVDLPISSVALDPRGNGGNRVRIILADDPGADVLIHYARGANGQATGPTSGARGNLRDSDPTVGLYTNAAGQPYPLWNWCVHSELETETL